MVYESNGDGNKTLSGEENLNKTRPYLKNIINNLKKSGTWDIQSTIAINVMSSKGTDEERLMHSNTDNIEIMINEKPDKVIGEHFESLLSRYQIWLETSMKGSSFIFDHVHLLYYKCHKTNPNLDESFIDSLV